jgi:hypothetical protein
MDLTAMWAAVLGALVGAGGAFAGVVVTQRETRRRELEPSLWQLRAQAYVELVSWTAWVQHWYIGGSPDPHERPLTVTMARTAARIKAFGDDETGDGAFELLGRLQPFVSSQNISGKPPPPDDIRALADELSEAAQRELSAAARR